MTQPIRISDVPTLLKDPYSRDTHKHSERLNMASARIIFVVVLIAESICLILGACPDPLTDPLLGGVCANNTEKTDDGKCCTTCLRYCPVGEELVANRCSKCTTCRLETYNSGSNALRCTECTRCEALNRSTLKKCSSTANTICRECLKGYYESDQKIEGLNYYACRLCQPNSTQSECMHSGPGLVTDTNHTGSLINNQLLVILIILVSVLVIISVCIGFSVCLWRKKKHNRSHGDETDYTSLQRKPKHQGDGSEDSLSFTGERLKLPRRSVEFEMPPPTPKKIKGILKLDVNRKPADGHVGNLKTTDSDESFGTVPRWMNNNDSRQHSHDDSSISNDVFDDSSTTPIPNTPDVAIFTKPLSVSFREGQFKSLPSYGSEENV